jgi:WD40 repeat protein
MLVSMKNGRVYGVGEPIGNPILYGRQKFVMSTSDRDGNRLIGLYADGSILELAIQPTGSEWKRLGYKLEPDEKRISLSPDGKRLAVYDAVQKRIRVLAVDSGAEEPAKREGIKLEGIVEFAWDPEQDAGLAVLNADGVLGIETDGPVQPIANLAGNLGAMQPNQLAFFQEKWSDPAQKPARHIVIYAEDKVLFVSRQEEPRVFEKVVGKGMQIAVSPKDSILATGNAEGTVRIWFASPGNEICQQVYDLAREEKSEVKRIAFSGDGDTLITSDVKKRVSAWMSQDKLSPGP